MSSQMTLWDTPNVTSSPALASGPAPCDSQDGPMIVLYGLDHAHVSPSVSPANRGGAEDGRHLWPEWFRLIRKRRPVTVFGEQVEAAIRHGWLDLVQDDMEGIGYAVGAVGLPAAGFGAPHIRQRLWFVADANSYGCKPGVQGVAPLGYGQAAEPDRGACGVEHTISPGLEGLARDGIDSDQSGWIDAQPVRPTAEAGPTGGFWRDCDWIPCRDGKARPVEPGTFPLVDGTSSRVVKLRAYGNAIVPQVAAEMIGAYMEKS